MNTTDPLDLFLPPCASAFRSTLGEPTFPSGEGWPAIAAGQHTLILAPTGSGKTLAAFLACFDHLWRQPTLSRGVRVLYVSPLKALQQRHPPQPEGTLEGIAQTAEQMGVSLPVLEAAVRTGDTTTAERQRLVRHPPHVLITTPNHCICCSHREPGRRCAPVTHVIIDEIHALCPNKRGVFLSLLLERLEALQPAGKSFVRIGLSATQRPLEEVARYLGGQTLDASGQMQQRPVTIVDGGLRRISISA